MLNQILMIYFYTGGSGISEEYRFTSAMGTYYVSGNW